MASFLDTHGIANALNQVITRAEKGILLITPYISFPSILFQRLLDADERGIAITIVFGKTLLKDKEIEHLAQLKNLSLFFLENLHAKCYCNEKTAVVSSMNLYDYSEKNNREMGILIILPEDAVLFSDISKECISILKAAEPIIRRGVKQNNSKQIANKNYKSNNTEEEGHCIRCKTPIPYNESAPYCRSCYSSWAVYKNADYREKYCHDCGCKHRTTMDDPFCDDCDLLADIDFDEEDD